MKKYGSYCKIVIFCILPFTLLLCGKKPANRVPLDQIDRDNSTNYRYIFRDAIQKQDKRDNRYKKNEFRE